MPKTPSTKPFDFDTWTNGLREACIKLKGMAYLIEVCGNHDCPPFDEDEAFMGISLVFIDLHNEVRAIAREMDEAQLSNGRDKHRRSGKRAKVSGDEDSPL